MSCRGRPVSRPLALVCDRVTGPVTARRGTVRLTMANRRSVVINGDLGSGKSTVSKLLAAQLGIRRVSIGELYRTIAAQRGMTALQLNLHAELDEDVDHYVD